MTSNTDIQLAGLIFGNKHIAREMGAISHKRFLFARRNGAPAECAQAFADAGNTEPTMGEFVDFLRTYLSR